MPSIAPSPKLQNWVVSNRGILIPIHPWWVSSDDPWITYDIDVRHRYIDALLEKYGRPSEGRGVNVGDPQGSAAIPQGHDPLVGWRAWRVPNGEELRSVAHFDAWPKAKKMVARCSLGHEHPAPHKSCTCGVYAHRVASAIAMKRWGVTARDTRIMGRVSLWGKVFLYTEGYRAQFAYPYELFVPCVLTETLREKFPGGAEHLAAALRRAYICDVTVVDFDPPKMPQGTDPALLAPGPKLTQALTADTKTFHPIAGRILPYPKGGESK